MINFFRRLINIPNKKIEREPNSSELIHEMLYSLAEANRLYDEKKYPEALLKFDLAVKSGLFDKEAYTDRGICLQSLDFHLDAIDDFTFAIQLLPYDPNNYFLRSLSLKQIGLYKQAISDNEKAILLSEIPSVENEEKNKKAIDMGYNCVADFYRIRLDLLLQETNFSQTIKDYIVKPKTRRII